MATEHFHKHTLILSKLICVTAKFGVESRIDYPNLHVDYGNTWIIQTLDYVLAHRDIKRISPATKRPSDSDG